MGFFKVSLMGFLFFLGTGAVYADPVEIPRIREVDQAAEHVFVPNGFDSNDNSEIIVSGWYPNPCHEWSRSIIHKHKNEVNIKLKALVKDGSDRVCIDMAVPFMESVKMGPMGQGDFQIHVGEKEASMHISKTDSGSIDDYIYGKVIHVTSADQKLTIEMEKPSSCLVFDQFKVVYNGHDTCAILPIMKQTSRTCPRDPSVFTQTLNIPGECLEKSEKVLFHIRSLEGKSVNYLYDNRSNLDL
jgi:hypothetical protein